MNQFLLEVLAMIGALSIALVIFVLMWGVVGGIWDAKHPGVRRAERAQRDTEMLS